MKKIIITGASGLVATELTLLLLSQTDAQLFLISTNLDNIQNRYRNVGDRVHSFTLASFSQYIKADSSFDVCIHTAFSRSSKGELIVQSLCYQQELISILKGTALKCFVNISSQSVYGKLSEPLWTESTDVAPDSLYAMGKYTSELVTRHMFEDTNVKWTNIRLCSVCENASFIRVFVKNALEGNPIHLSAPDQYCSFIDIRDVAAGLLHLIQSYETIRLEPIYNLGANLLISIREIAMRVKAIGERRYDLSPIVITESSSENHIRIGVNSDLFMRTFGWTPLCSMDDMLISMFEILTDVESD